MLSRMGIRIDASSLLLRNVAAVMVTATLPAFSKPGSQIDIVVSSIGNARSLTGGTLILTPLLGVDSQTYAMAQGPVQVGGFGAGGSGGGIQKNHLNVGRVPQGAIVERSVEFRLSLGAGATLGLQLNHPDFTTARNVTDAINRASRIFGVDNEIAMIMDSGAIQMQVPEKLRSDVGRFIAIIESLEVFPDAIAKIVINSRTGTVVMGANVQISSVAVAHGGLTIRVEQASRVAQPNPLAGGTTVVIPGSNITVEEAGGSIQLVEESVTLADVVRGLNILGAKPRDLIDILQAIKAAGGLHGDLEVL
jgi:flagellar P-ring protein precursor FlgI